MARKDNQIMWVIITFIAIAVFYYAGSQGFFKSDTFSALNQTPSPNTPVYNSCNQVCTSNGFNKFYSFVDSCKEGEAKVTYGYVGQTPILTCCCYNEESAPPATTGTCTETDGGNVDTVPGTTTARDGIARMDICTDSTHVQEYWCIADGSGDWQSGIHSCLSGQTCLSSRSGGYCRTKTWNNGDTVLEGSGSGSLVGGEEAFGEIDLGDYGISTDGTCRLGAQIQTNWVYASPQCSGLQGFEAVIWKFYDSAGLEYERTDTSPTGLGVDLSPATGHNLQWDGINNWRGYMNKRLNIPGCVINYDYSIKIYIYDC